MSSSVTLLFFASLRERLGVGSLVLELDASFFQNQPTVTTLIEYLASVNPHQMASTIANTTVSFWQNLVPTLHQTLNLTCAINQRVGALNSPIKADDEIAFFPPVTGG